MKHFILSILLSSVVLFVGCGAGIPGDSEVAESEAEPAVEIQEVAPLRAEFAAGSKLVIRTIPTLSSKSAKSGESFDASLEEPLVSGTWVVAAKGASVKGLVIESDQGGRVKGTASLSVKLTELQLADGRWIDIDSGSHVVQAKSTVKKDAVKVGIASGVGAAIGAIAGGGSGAAKGAAIGAGAGGGVVLATRGEAAVIGSESVISFKLANGFDVVEQR
jgi:hypothetical protein